MTNLCLRVSRFKIKHNVSDIKQKTSILKLDFIFIKTLTSNNIKLCIEPIFGVIVKIVC